MLSNPPVIITVFGPDFVILQGKIHAPAFLGKVVRHFDHDTFIVSVPPCISISSTKEDRPTIHNMLLPIATGDKLNAS
jgi:hypothetical protein